MSAVRTLTLLSAGLLAALALTPPAADAQVAPKEGIPGGVEVKPSIPTISPKAGDVASPTMSAPAPMMRAPASSPVLESAPAAAAPMKKSKPAAKDKKSEAPKPSKQAPLAVTRSLAPGAAQDTSGGSSASPAPAPAPIPGLPPIGGNEGRPGAVERTPTQTPAPQ
jgi:hypothetical protein